MLSLPPILTHELQPSDPLYEQQYLTYRDDLHFYPDKLAESTGRVLEQRGKGYRSEAQASLAAYLFAAFPVARAQASTDLENRAEQRALSWA